MHNLGTTELEDNEAQFSFFQDMILYALALYSFIIQTILCYKQVAHFLQQIAGREQINSDADTTLTIGGGNKIHRVTSKADLGRK